jgi:prephenate dehydrogenase
MNPEFEQVSIVGVGFMGGSIALALKKYGLSKKIIGVSRQETIKKALSLNIIDDGFSYENIDEGIKNASLIILCSPINVIIEHIKLLSKMVSPGTIITDIGSTKLKIMETAEEFIPDNVYFIGGHPMAGSEQSGIDTAEPGIYVNKSYVLVPKSDTPDEITEMLRNVIVTIGSIPYILDAKTHDEIVAVVSHLPQIASIALMNTVGSFDRDLEKCLELTGGGFQDMTRIASSKFKIWKDICETNQDYIKKAISSYIKKLEDVKELIGKDGLKDEFGKSNRLRELLDNIKKNG